MQHQELHLQTYELFLNRCFHFKTNKKILKNTHIMDYLWTSSPNCWWLSQKSFSILIFYDFVVQSEFEPKWFIQRETTPTTVFKIHHLTSINQWNLQYYASKKVFHIDAKFCTVWSRQREPFESCAHAIGDLDSLYMLFLFFPIWLTNFISSCFEYYHVWGYVEIIQPRSDLIKAIPIVVTSLLMWSQWGIWLYLTLF